MLSPKYFIYLAIGNQNQPIISITVNPRVDAIYLEKLGYYELLIIQPPQPIWAAEIVLSKLKGFPTALNPAKFLKVASQLTSELLGLSTKYFSVVRETISEIKLLDFNPPDIESLVWGRSLLGSEVVELLKSNGLNIPWDPEDWLQYYWLQGYIRREATIGIDFLGMPVCRRCGATKTIIEDDCLYCGNRHCYTCTECQSLGISKSCTPLYFNPYPDKPAELNEPIKPVLNFELTPPQKRASDELERFIDSTITNPYGQHCEFLVWAVCGGGKTEVCFQAVAKGLTRGWRILYAIPRKDVVIELLPRFQQAFPTVEIAALYGGSGNKFTDPSLTMATTHQCLRFFERFDLVILDEADAYPYQGSAMLHYAVKRSLKTTGRIIIMTATPDDSLINRARSGKLPFVSIPARFHRRPLVVPELVKLDFKLTGNNLRNWEPPLYVSEFLLNCHANHRPVLIFLPTIQQIENLGQGLVKWGITQGLKATITHSKCTNRVTVKEALENGQLDFLVTSTILERGITIPHIDVLVLFADNEIVFDCRTLVQIAGRAGRLGEPATVVFLGKTFTKSMKDTCKLISEMNLDAVKLGYID